MVIAITRWFSLAKGIRENIGTVVFLPGCWCPLGGSGYVTVGNFGYRAGIRSLSIIKLYELNKRERLMTLPLDNDNGSSDG